MTSPSKPEGIQVSQGDVVLVLEGVKGEGAGSSHPSFVHGDPVDVAESQDSIANDEAIGDQVQSEKSASAPETPTTSRGISDDDQRDLQEVDEEHDVGASEPHHFVPKGKFNPPSSGPKPKPKPPRPSGGMR